MFQDFEEDCCKALPGILERHLTESETAKSTGNVNFWKHREAAMLALGTVKKHVERQIHAGNMNFDIAGFLENVVLVDVVNPGEKNAS